MDSTLETSQTDRQTDLQHLIFCNINIDYSAKICKMYIDIGIHNKRFAKFLILFFVNQNCWLKSFHHNNWDDGKKTKQWVFRIFTVAFDGLFQVRLG